MKFSRVSRAVLAGALALPLSFGAFTGIQGAFAQDSDANPVVARVNNTEIRLSTIKERFEAMAQSQPQLASVPLAMVYDQLLETVIDSELLTEAGRAAGLDKDPTVIKRSQEVFERLVGAAYLDKTVEKTVTDADIQKAYDEAKAAFKPEREVHARHILVDSEEKAKALIARLKKGENFAKLAGENTKDPSGKTTGGDLGYFTKDRMVAPFAEAAFALKPGTFTQKPVKTEFGWHVIKVDDARDTSFPTLEQVKPQIRAQLANKAMDAEMTALRQKAKVELFTMDGKPKEEKAAPGATVAPAAEQPAAAPAAEKTEPAAPVEEKPEADKK